MSSNSATVNQHDWLHPKLHQKNAEMLPKKKSFGYFLTHLFSSEDVPR